MAKKHERKYVIYITVTESFWGPDVIGRVNEIFPSYNAAEEYIKTLKLPYWQNTKIEEITHKNRILSSDVIEDILFILLCISIVCAFLFGSL